MSVQVIEVHTAYGTISCLASLRAAQAAAAKWNATARKASPRGAHGRETESSLMTLFDLDKALEPPVCEQPFIEGYGCTPSQGLKFISYIWQVAGDDNLALLMMSIQSACRQVAGAAEMLGCDAGHIDPGAKGLLQQLANAIFCKELSTSGEVSWMSSAADKKWVEVEAGGGYWVTFDALNFTSDDGVKAPCSSIFTVFPATEDGPKENLENLRGRRAVAAGYCLYSGGCATMVFTMGQGTHGFVLRDATGDFVMTEPEMQLAEHGRGYCVDPGSQGGWTAAMQRFISSMTAGGPGEAHLQRYTGSICADFHQLLCEGGVACSFDHGLQLLYEGVPLTLLAEQAGGKGSDGTATSLLDLTPTSREQRLCAVIGSRGEVLEAEKYMVCSLLPRGPWERAAASGCTCSNQK